MTSIKRSISFVAEPIKSTAKGKQGKEPKEARLRCNVAWNGNRARLGTDLRVDIKGWSATAQRCKARSCHGASIVPAMTLNNEIDKIETLVESVFADFEKQDIIPSRQELIAEYNGRLKGEEPGTEDDESIFPVFDKYIENGLSTGRWTAGTLKRIRVTRRHLEDISPTMTFDDIEKNGMTAIIRYLATREDKKKQTGLTNPTVNKEISVVKSFVRWATENGHCRDNRFVVQRARLKSAQKVVIFLDWDELMTVYNHDFSGNPKLDQVRDVFCFCCFTSLRYSDVHNLKWSDISEDTIKVTTIKTDDSLTIELNKYSRAILAKYRGKVFKDDMALPVISNQRMNDYIKEVGKACEINEPIKVTTYKGSTRTDTVYQKWELLSTHAGRRTFVCNALTLGISPNIVMKWTGHSDYKAMKPYIEIADRARKTAMTAFDNADDSTDPKNVPE